MKLHMKIRKGEWHLGYTPATMPNGQGFDYSFGHMGGCIDNYSHFFYWVPPNEHDLWRNGEEVWYDGQFFGDLMVEECVRFVDRNKARPFFLYWAINMPHYPLQGTEKWRRRYRDLDAPRRHRNHEPGRNKPRHRGTADSFARDMGQGGRTSIGAGDIVTITRRKAVYARRSFMPASCITNGTIACRCTLFVGLMICLLGHGTHVARGEWGVLSDMHNYHACFDLDPRQSNVPNAGVSPQWKLQGRYKVVMIESNAPGNVYHEGGQPRLTFQIENLTDGPLAAEGKVEAIRYSQSSLPDDPWYPELRRLEKVGSVPLAVDLAAHAWRNVTVQPPMAETKGGYGFVVDLGEHGRQFLTSAVRTFKPEGKRIQYPKQCLEHMPGPILERLGIQAVRYGVSFITRDEGRAFEQLRTRLEHDLEEMHAHKVTCIAEIGAGTKFQPLGQGRPHLDENGVMQGGKQDLCWLPERDDEYQAFVYELACRYGWPKGPITGFMLWNEPWEGLSISGWAADIPRYRNLYKRMGDAVFQARRDAGVDVLVGGCDSSTNTIDKLFPDGSDDFLPYLDFCSIHYQGLHSPVLYPQWNRRTHYRGRVLIWDTESWTANTDDRFLGVVATNRAAGYDRSLGSLSRNAVATLSHHRVGMERIHTPDGDREIPRWIDSRPLAASYGAVQQFIGERDFKEILFRNGLPWVFVFEGRQGNPDDGTVVVVGDIGTLFGGNKTTGVLFDTVRSFDELKAKQELKRRRAALPTEAEEERAALAKQITTPMPLTNTTLTLDLPAGCAAFDTCGNPTAAPDAKVTIPLDERGVFLRGDPQRPGSFAALLEALRQSRIEGLEPLETIAYDMTAPIATRPVVRLRLTNQRNQPIQGKLTVRLDPLAIDYPGELRFQPREQKWIDVQVTGGAAVGANAYALELVFDAGPDGIARHEETLRVNTIARRRIRIDGRLDDWQGILPQPIDATGSGGPSFEQAMLFPFEAFTSNHSGGVAVGYVAHDDDYFYFAAKIADDTPQDGTVRFATRDPDADFYPDISYEPVDERGRRVELGKQRSLREHRWPQGVRRFSYRRWPDIPSSMPQLPRDNVLIAFNAIPLGEDGWESHLPGRMPKFVWYKTTDYEFALNKVAQAYGGGTEIWRLWSPGMIYKHFYPRQPKAWREGPAQGQLEIRYVSGTRIVECALPWSEIPHVKQLRDAGQCVKFSFRVNHQTRGPEMELPVGRSAAEGLSPSFHPNWVPHWPNELEFGFECDGL
jgi:hypothetical protein